MPNKVWQLLYFIFHSKFERILGQQMVWGITDTWLHPHPGCARSLSRGNPSYSVCVDRDHSE